MGSFQGKLASVPATRLGSIAIEGALKHAGARSLSGAGGVHGPSAPSRCRSSARTTGGSRSWGGSRRSMHHREQGVRQRHESHRLGCPSHRIGRRRHVVVAGGMENMSMVPHYLQGRNGAKFGDIKVKDGMLLDGLTDVYNATHMGNCAELCAREKGISREDQDAFAVESYRRATEAWQDGKFSEEVFLCLCLSAGENLWWWTATKNTPTFVWTRFPSCDPLLTRQARSPRPTHPPSTTALQRSCWQAKRPWPSWG